jgi:hypothetical protein
MAEQHLESIDRLTRDLAKSASTLSEQEVRYLVDYYYICQEDRKRANNQQLALDEAHEPCMVISWLAAQAETLESQIKRALEVYTKAHPVGKWLNDQYGIGPVISAGLLAHIDITKAPTVGHIWRYAGLDPTMKWEKGQKRPWNGSLKTLCWKIGQSFMKFSNREDCYYGKIYRERKEYEVARNERKENVEAVAKALEKVGKHTEAYQHLIQGKLPPAQIDARARRYAVKMFLSHLHHIWYEIHYGEKPPKPFAIAILNHAHYIPPPGLEGE